MKVLKYERGYAMLAKPKLSFNAPNPAKAGGSTERRPDRIGKRLLQAHLPATTVIELKILAAKKGVSVVSLVEEAVALLLAQYKDDFT
jgi:hypothetical protein